MATAMQALTKSYMGRFPQVLRHAKRTIGREAEFPVVESNGEAGDVQRLMRSLMGMDSTLEVTSEDDGERISSLRSPDGTIEYTIEVGTGTVEVITGPFPDLGALNATHEDAVGGLVRAANTEGLAVLGCGMQPLTPASAELMTARPRYKTLEEILGPGWLWFSATASDQVHVDICAPEVASVTSACNAMVPAIIALCGNSGVHSGSSSEYTCTREGMMGIISAAVGRHGLPPSPVADIDEWMEQITSLDYLIKLVEFDDAQYKVGERVTVPAMLNGAILPFSDHLAQAGAGWDDFANFEMHEHYVWHSARPRPKQSTVELRSACQQPGDSHMAASALSLGLVEATPQLLQYVLTGEVPSSADSGASELPEGWANRLKAEWPRLRRLHHEAMTTGLANADVAEFSAGALEICSQGLERRGLGESEWLLPLFSRLKMRQNPAQLAQATLETGGMEKLINELRI